MQSLFPWVLAICLFPPAPSQQPKPVPKLQDILDELVARSAQADQRLVEQAKRLLDQADTAQRAGQGGLARELATKASRFAPENPEVQARYRKLVTNEREARDGKLYAELLRDRLREGLLEVDALLHDGKTTEAKDFLDAVRMATANAPKELDVAALREALQQINDDPRWERAEPRPMPPPKDSLEAKLGARINVEWRGESLRQAVADLSRLSGIPMVMDGEPASVALGTVRKVDLKVFNGSVDQILRLLTEKTGSGHALVDGRLVFMDRLKAQKLSAQKRVEAPPEVQPRERPSEVQAGAPRDVPAYLRSGKAYTAEIDRLQQLHGSKRE